MLAAERREKITEFLCKYGSVQVEELSQKLQVVQRRYGGIY